MTTKATNTIDKIAREILDLETLETRNSDSLDFHEKAGRSAKPSKRTTTPGGIRGTRK